MGEDEQRILKNFMLARILGEHEILCVGYYHPSGLSAHQPSWGPDKVTLTKEGLSIGDRRIPLHIIEWGVGLSGCCLCPIIPDYLTRRQFLAIKLYLAIPMHPDRSIEDLRKYAEEEMAGTQRIQL